MHIIILERKIFPYCSSDDRSKILATFGSVINFLEAFLLVASTWRHITGSCSDFRSRNNPPSFPVDTRIPSKFSRSTDHSGCSSQWVSISSATRSKSRITLSKFSSLPVSRNSITSSNSWRLETRFREDVIELDSVRCLSCANNPKPLGQWTCRRPENRFLLLRNDRIFLLLPLHLHSYLRSRTSLFEWRCYTLEDIEYEWNSGLLLKTWTDRSRWQSPLQWHSREVGEHRLPPSKQWDDYYR